MTREEAERIAARLVDTFAHPSILGNRTYHCLLVAGREVGATFTGEETEALASKWREAIVRALVEG